MRFVHKFLSRENNSEVVSHIVFGLYVSDATQEVCQVAAVEAAYAGGMEGNQTLIILRLLEVQTGLAQFFQAEQTVSLTVSMGAVNRADQMTRRRPEVILGQLRPILERGCADLFRAQVLAEVGEVCFKIGWLLAFIFLGEEILKPNDIGHHLPIDTIDIGRCDDHSEPIIKLKEHELRMERTEEASTIWRPLVLMHKHHVLVCLMLFSWLCCFRSIFEHCDWDLATNQRLYHLLVVYHGMHDRSLHFGLAPHL